MGHFDYETGLFDECEPERRFYWQRENFNSEEQAIALCGPHLTRKNMITANFTRLHSMKATWRFYEKSLAFCHHDKYNVTCAKFGHYKQPRNIIFESGFDSETDAMRYNGIYRLQKSNNHTYKKHDGQGDILLIKRASNWIIR